MEDRECPFFPPAEGVSILSHPGMWGEIEREGRHSPHTGQTWAVRTVPGPGRTQTDLCQRYEGSGREKHPDERRDPSTAPGALSPSRSACPVMFSSGEKVLVTYSDDLPLPCGEPLQHTSGAGCAASVLGTPADFFLSSIQPWDSMNPVLWTCEKESTEE